MSSISNVLLNFNRLSLEPLIKPTYQVPKIVKIFNLNAEPVGEVELPIYFHFPVRIDLIRRAFLSAFTMRLQPKGTDPMAGKRTTAESFGVGLGIARLPRIKGHLWPRAAFAPNTVGGRRAHPPKVEKKIHEYINKKEKKLAIISAIAATAIPELVKSRGHIIDNVLQVPLIITNDFEELMYTSEVKRVFKKLGLWDDVERAHDRTRIRAGKGKMRGRRYKTPKSVLVVLGRKSQVFKAVQNLPGTDVTLVDNLNILHLAPGGVPGRLTLWTLSAIEKLRDRFKDII
ncbi:MAG: 50S ribosomal protein L4 [Thermoprotei archaeon ex4572_64]|nr:MAG: 50S ribosomal protein L4 [Thermoprotei archaeon ex4572_64]